ncbi:MAG: alpha/beta hydrolase [Bacteroidota bacterium]
MKYSFILSMIFCLSFISCDQEDGELIISPEESAPIVKQVATFPVITEKNITYAEGLSHDSLNSSNYTVIPIKLDIYAPNNSSKDRPVFMFIHGGAFENGSKSQAAIVNIANFFASRGWVFISIDYRLKGDTGTVPEEWASFASSLPVSDDNKASFNAMYPAQRDAKAALRWIIANKDNYNINADYITVGGASAGANTAKGIVISDLNDFTDEISTVQDPTLLTTNLEEIYTVQTIIDFWGGQSVTDAFEVVYGRDLFDPNDPVLYKAHGTADFTVPFSSALDLQEIYESIGVTMKLDTLIGVGHGDFKATLNNKSLEELAFDFITEQQNLIVE